MITKTDKSGRLFVSSMEGYRGGGMKHVGVDRKVTREKARAIERRLENLGELSVKCMGEAHGERNVVRVRKAYRYHQGRNNPTIIHNAEWPPSRPVCGAGMAATSRVGDQLCMFVERVVDNVEGLCESKSVEDIMAWMEEANDSMCEEAIQRERELNCEGEVEVNVREMVCGVVGDMTESAMRSKVEIMCEEVIGELVNAVMGGEDETGRGGKWRGERR